MSSIIEKVRMKRIKSYKIRDGVRLICREAFSDCIELEKIELPSSLNFISEEAFFGCVNLNEIIIPNSVVYIGDRAFDCDGEYEYYNHTITRKKPFFISIPPSLEIIDGNPFCQNTILSCNNTRFKVVENVLYSADGKILISYCSQNDNFVIPDGVIRIGMGAFRNRSVKSVTFPETLEIIDKEAFENANLEAISFPKSIKEIRRKAFDWCNLKTSCIELPPNIEIIDSDAFRFDLDIKMIKVPKGCLEHYKSILPKKLANHLYDEDFVFENNLYLSSNKSELIVAVNGEKNYTIPEGVVSIRDYAFDSIYYIDSIKLPSTLQNITRNAFDKEIQELNSIIVPKGSRQFYEGIFDKFKDEIKEY